jgi:hypothetical protein
MVYSIKKDSNVMVYEVATGSVQDSDKEFCEHSEE